MLSGNLDKATIGQHFGVLGARPALQKTLSGCITATIAQLICFLKRTFIWKHFLLLWPGHDVLQCNTCTPKGYNLQGYDATVCHTILHDLYKAYTAKH